MAINTSGGSQNYGQGGFLPPGTSFQDGLPTQGITTGVQPTRPQGVLGNVQGGQYNSPGANGVTQYGLFSRQQQGGRSVLPPPAPPAQPGISLPPTYGNIIRGQPPGSGQMPSPPGFQPPSFGRGGFQPPRGFAPPGFQPPRFDTGQIAQQPTLPMQRPSTPPSPLNRLGSFDPGRFAQTNASGIPQRTVAQQGQGGAPQLDMSNAGQGTQMQAQERGNGFNIPDLYGNGTRVGWDQSGPYADPYYGSDNPQNPNPGEETPVGDNLAGAIGGQIGTSLGQGFADFTNAWNDATGGGGGNSWFNFLQGQMPGFQQSSLMGDVGQNMTSMMDPAAWEQMAANRNASADQANLAGLNTAERRLADLQGRTGLSNTGGVQGQMYQDFANRGIQSQRDIFNDTLGNQMNAIGQAGNFALGQNAQDQQRWSQLLGMAGMGANADFGAYRQDNPSGAAMLQDIFAGLGGVAGAGMQAGGSLAGMLPLLLAM